MTTCVFSGVVSPISLVNVTMHVQAAILLRTTIGLQLASRLVTFVLTTLVVRRISPSVYGLAGFRLRLLNASVLLLSREACRRSCLRKDNETSQSKAEELRSALPFALLPIPIGAIALFSFVLYLKKTTDPNSLPPVLLYEHMFAIGVELLSEPFYIIGSLWLQFRLRTRVEGLAILTKSSVACVLLTCTGRDPALAFADAQVAYGMVLLLGYITLLPQIARLLWDCREKEKLQQLIDWKRARFTLVFFIQTIGKWIFAEGSKFVLMGHKSLHVEGVYGLVENLGSSVVRIIFQPLEEAAFTAFSRTGTSNHQEEIRKTARVLTALIRCVFLVGFLAMIFGPPSTTLLLQFLYSSKWSDTEAPAVLACYCPYIAIMALNGICEAFVHAVLDAKKLGQSNLFMLFSASLHIAVSIVFVKSYGAFGLIAADGVTMLARIIFALWCIKRYFAQLASFNVTSLFPRPVSLIAGVAVSLTLFVCNALVSNFHAFALKLTAYGLAGLVSLGVVLWTMWKQERSAWSVLIELRQGDKTTKDD